MNRRGFLGRLLGASFGTALACKVEVVDASVLKRLDAPPLTCLDLQPDGWWIKNLRAQVLKTAPEFHHRNSPLLHQLEGIIEPEVTVVFGGPKCFELGLYFQEMMERS